MSESDMNESETFRNATTTTRLVLAALRSGAAITTRDAVRMASEKAGRPVHPGTVSGILSRIADPSRCDLGHFVRRGKSGGGQVFLLAEEALEMTEAQTYGLTLRIGADRYPLSRALAEYPRLRDLFDAEELSPEESSAVAVVPSASASSDHSRDRESRADSAPVPPPARREANGIRRKPSVVQVVEEPEYEADPPRRPVEVSFRLGGEDALSLKTSAPVFWILCLALGLVAASLAMLAYTVLMPLLVVAAGAAGITGTLWFLWRRRVRARKRAEEAGNQAGVR
jgi:hypothetical protein